MRSKAHCLALLLAAATTVRAECPVRVQIACSEPAADSSRCTFSLQGSAPTTSLPSLQIRFEPDPEPASYRVEPSTIAVGSGSPADAVVTVQRSDRTPGLVRLLGKVTGGLTDECNRIDLPMDFLLQDLRVAIAGTGAYDDASKDHPPDSALRVGAVEPIDLTVCDDKGQPIRVPVPLTLTIKGLDGTAEVGARDNSLAASEVVLIPARQASQRIWVRPVKPGLGRVMAEVRLDQSKRILGRITVRVRAEHSLGNRLAVFLLGGIGYWALTLLAQFAGGWKFVLLALARTLGACALGFAILPQLGAWGVNLHADPTQLSSQFLAGIALAGLGPEGLLTLFGKKSSRTGPAPDVPPQPPIGGK